MIAVSPGVAETETETEPPAPTAATATTATSFGDYLAIWNIDRGSRRVLEEPSAWSPAKQEAALRVLARLARVPGSRAVEWNADAVEIGDLPASSRVQDRLVKVGGRATFVAALPLPVEQA
jgi:hypothetical protein